MVVCICPYQKSYTIATKRTKTSVETKPAAATTTAATPTAKTTKQTNSIELMGPWYIIGALLLLSARAGDSTNKIIIPQQIGSNIVNTNVANGMHHHMTKTSITTTGNKGTVVSGNGVIVAGGSMHGPSSSLNSK